MIWSKSDLNRILAAISQADALRRVGDLFDQEVAIDYGDNDIFVCRCCCAVDDKEISTMDPKAIHGFAGHS